MLMILCGFSVLGRRSSLQQFGFLLLFLVGLDLLHSKKDIEWSQMGCKPEELFTLHLVQLGDNVRQCVLDTRNDN